jgi:hypothetical protein
MAEQLRDGRLSQYDRFYTREKPKSGFLQRLYQGNICSAFFKKLR